MGKCKYTLTINGENILYNVDEAAINDEILGNILNYLTEEDVDIRYRKDFGELVSYLDEINERNYKLLAADRAFAREQVAEALGADIEDSEEYGDGYVSVLNFIEKSLIKEPFNELNYRRNKRSKIMNDPNLLKTMLPRLAGNEDLSNLAPDLISTLANEAIEYTIKSWDYSKALGKGLHYIASVVFNPTLRNTDNLDINSIKNYIYTHKGEIDIPGLTLEGIDEETFNAFIKQLVSLKYLILKKRPGSIPKVYTDFVLTGETATGVKLRGKLDLMVVYDDGTVDIYDLKVSTNISDEWDRDKKTTYNYQLGIYKRLLEKEGIPFTDINIKIIPVVATRADKGVSSLQFEGTLIVSPDVKELSRIDTFIPVDKVNLDTPIIDRVLAKLNAFFPATTFTSGVLKVTIKTIEDRFVREVTDGWALSGPLNEKPVIYKTREELDEAIIKLQENYSAEIRDKTKSISNALSEDLSLRNKDEIAFRRMFMDSPATLFSGRSNKLLELRILSQLLSYRTELGWLVLKSDELVNMGVIVLVNTNSHKIDVVSVSNLDLFARVNFGKGRTTILGNYVEDKFVETDRSKMDATVGNLEVMKAIAIVDELVKDSNFKGYTINEVKAISTVEPQTHTEFMLDRALQYYNKLCARSEGILGTDLTPTDRLSKIITAIDNITMYSDKNKDLLNVLKSITISDVTKSLLLDLLKQLRDLIYEAYYYKKLGPDIDSLEGYLYRIVNTEIAFLEGVGIDLMNADVWDKYGINVKAWKQRRLLNGTEINTSDTIPLIEPIHRLLNNLNSNLRKKYTFYKDKDRKIVDEFKRKHMSLGANKLTNIYSPMWKNLIDTTYVNKFRVKNPWKDKTLDTVDKEFLIYWLESINSVRYKGASEDYIDDLKATGEYFDIPLLRASTTSRLTGGRGVGLIVKDLFGQEIKNVTGGLANDELSKIFVKENMELNLMYNIFDSLEDVSYRAKELTGVNPMEIFETNLEEVKDMYIFSKIRQEAYNKIIPAINAALILLDFATLITGRPSEEIVKYIIDFMNSSVFNSNLVKDDSYKDALSYVNAAKSISSMAILGLNYLSGIKEIGTGFYTLYSRSLANSMFDKDKVGLLDMLKAYGYVWADSLHLINNVTLMEHLNRIYGMSNMDVNGMVLEANYHAAEAFRFRSRMFCFNRAPDYLHRMTILIGYMMKYDCFDAYSVDGELVKYDWKKDGRFKALAAGDTSNPEYNNLRALYNRMKQLFIKDKHEIYDKSIGGWRQVNEDDELPDAFTELEANRARSEANTLFGYMDHDTKSLFYRRGIGVIIGQFLTYITAKKNLWFLKRDVYGDGKWMHMLNDEGLKLYWTRKTKNGVIESVVTTEVTDEPVWDWKGKINEGILWSILDMINVMHPTELVKAWADPIKQRNLFIGASDILMVIILGWIMRSLTDDGEVDINKASFGDRAVFKVIRNIQGDLDPWKTFTGAVDFLFTSFKFFKTLGADALDVCTGDTKVTDFIANTFSFARPFKKEMRESLY